MTSPCHQCTAACCRQTTAPAAVMLHDNEVDYETVIIRDHLLGDVRAIPYIDGNCFYLEGNDCGIYDRRPELCREFQCVSGYKCKPNDRHNFFLEDHPKVLELIELNLGPLLNNLRSDQCLK